MSDKEESVHIEEGDDEEANESMHEEEADYIEKDNLEGDGDDVGDEEEEEAEGEPEDGDAVEGEEEEVEQEEDEQEQDADEDEEMVDDNEILEDDVDPEDDEEQKEEEEETPMKKRAKYIVPSRQDFKSDTQRELQERTVMVGPISLKDVLNIHFLDTVKGASHVSIRFCKPKKAKSEETTEKKDVADKKEEKKDVANEKDKTESPPNDIKENGSDDKSENVEELKGVFEVRFNTVDEANTFIEEVGEMGEHINVSRVNWEFVKSEEYKTLKNMAMQFDAEGISGHRLNRTVALCGLALDLDKEKLMEAIPLASEITLPKNYESDEMKGYAYVEVPTLAKLKELHKSNIVVDEINYKLHSLEDIPTVARVMKMIDDEKMDENLRSPLDPGKKDRLQLLLSYAIHHEKMDELTEKDKEGLEKRLSILRLRLREDKNFRISRSSRQAPRRPLRGGSSRPSISSSYRGGSSSSTREYRRYDEPRGRYSSYDSYKDDRPRRGGYRESSDNRSNPRRYETSGPRGNSYRGNTSNGYRGGSNSYRGGSSLRGGSSSSYPPNRKRTYANDGPPQKRRTGGSWYDDDRASYYV